MVGHKVYAIWSNPIVRDALRTLLSHPDIIWTGDESVIDQAVEDILLLKPDTVLVETDQDTHPGQLIDRLQVEDFRLQIISLNIDTNEVTLYHRDYRSVVHQEDLLQFILTPFAFGGTHDD